MLFIHNRCGENLYIDISEDLLCLVTVSLSRDGMRPIHLELIPKNSNEKFSFFCPHCNTKVVEDDIHILCMNCGKTKSIKEDKLFTLGRSGGIYCEICCEEYFSNEDKHDLRTAIRKIRFPE